MKHFLISMSLLLLFAACTKHEDESRGPLAEGRRTVIVYVSGDNTLSSFTRGDLQEMVNGAASGLSADDRFVIFVDRISSTEKPFIARITGDARQPVDTLYKYPTDIVASEPSQFREVLTRIQGLCPAREYGLVLWGHGTGWTIETSVIPTQTSSAPRRAYGIDNGNTSSGTNRGLWLNIPDMRRVFEQMGTHWKFIFADCCNMMCVEVGYELRQWADYLIGSPAEIPGAGAPYDKIVAHLFSQSDTFCQDIVDTYAQANPDYLPLSVLRLSEMDRLATATRQVMPQIRAHLALGDASATRGIIYYCSPGGQYDDVNKLMYDMNHMILTACADDMDAYNAWHEAFSRAVAYRVTSPLWATNNGNTVCFSDFNDSYGTIDNIGQKQGCISMFFPLEKYDSPRCSHPYNSDILQLLWWQAVAQ